MRRESWRRTLGDAGIAGSFACAATAATAAACGSRESGSATAAINAISHIVWGDEAYGAPVADVKYTFPGLLLNFGASVFWALIYERAFGEAAERGNVVKAVLGGATVSALAYVTDYHVVPKRLTPGWEERVSNRSLALIYGALALSLPLRGFLSRYTERSVNES